MNICDLNRSQFFAGFLQASSPACTELEILIMNWLGKMIGLTDDFLHTSNDSTGGGVIQVNFFAVWKLRVVIN